LVVRSDDKERIGLHDPGFWLRYGLCRSGPSIATPVDVSRIPFTPQRASKLEQLFCTQRGHEFRSARKTASPYAGVFMQYRLAATWDQRPALIAALRYPYEIVDRYEEAVVAMLQKRKGRSGEAPERGEPHGGAPWKHCAGSHLYVG
jgi:hypothetical protein